MTQLSLDLARDDRSAVISPCGLYRYRLGRRWSDGPTAMFVMLNPSKADAETPDPTMTRCVNYARRWGFGAISIGNLFALRSTDPTALYKAPEPIGLENDYHLLAMASESSLVVGGWGNHGIFRGRAEAVRAMFPAMKILKLTGSGQPTHPLYLPANLDPIDWN